jgi:glycosyltransferase involved in cell wall biosynthesis
MELSVVIPVFNEETDLEETCRKLKSVLEKIKITYEIIFIDDGSTDGTFSILEKMGKSDKNVRIIKFRRNSGKTAALSAGFEMAEGKIIVTMDGDMQNEPSDIPMLLKKINEGYDVVSGWRKNRKDPFISKKVPSIISNWLASKSTGLKIHDFNCPLKAYRRECAKDIRLFGEMHRYIPAIAYMNGFRVTELEVRHYPRKHGKSKYGFGRLVKGFLDLIYLVFWSSYSTRPFHFFGLISLIEIFLGFLIIFYKIIIETFVLRMPFITTPAALLAMVLIISGIQLFVFGFLMEVQIRTYYRDTKEAYKIEKVINK